MSSIWSRHIFDWDGKEIKNKTGCRERQPEKVKGVGGVGGVVNSQLKKKRKRRELFFVAKLAINI